MMARDAVKPSRSKGPPLRARLGCAGLLSFVLTAALAASPAPAFAQASETPDVAAPNVIVNLGVLQSLGPVQAPPAASGEGALRSAELLPPPPSPPKSRLLGQYAAEAPAPVEEAPAPVVKEAPAAKAPKPKPAQSAAAPAAQVAEAPATEKPAKSKTKKEKTAKAERKEKAAKASAGATSAAEETAPAAAPTTATADSVAAATPPAAAAAAAGDEIAAEPVVPPPPAPVATASEIQAPESQAPESQAPETAATAQDAAGAVPEPPGAVQTAAVAPEAEVETPGSDAAPLQTETPKGFPDIAVEQVLFGPGSAELSPEETAALEKLATQLAAAPDLRIQLRAYAGGKDASANAARRLSLSRALAVRDFLVDKGIATARVQVRALGPTTDGPPDRVDIEPQGS